jgi:hypothetical protein
MTKDRGYGHTPKGNEIDEELVTSRVKESEVGYDVDTLIARRGRRGRPSLSNGESSLESFRIDDDLRTALTSPAESDAVNVSELPRRAVRGTQGRLTISPFHPANVPQAPSIRAVHTSTCTRLIWCFCSSELVEMRFFDLPSRERDTAHRTAPNH